MREHRTPSTLQTRTTDHCPRDVPDVAGGGSEVHDRHRSRTRHAECVYVRHDVVAELRLLLLRQLVVDVRQVRLWSDR